MAGGSAVAAGAPVGFGDGSAAAAARRTALVGAWTNPHRGVEQLDAGDAHQPLWHGGFS